MSLEAWGDEGDIAERGEDTQMYHDLLVVMEKWSAWRRQWKDEIPGPDHEKLADAVSEALGEFQESLCGKL